MYVCMYVCMYVYDRVGKGRERKGWAWYRGKGRGLTVPFLECRGGEGGGSLRWGRFRRLCPIFWFFG